MVILHSQKHSLLKLSGSSNDSKRMAICPSCRCNKNNVFSVSVQTLHYNSKFVGLKCI